MADQNPAGTNTGTPAEPPAQNTPPATTPLDTNQDPTGSPPATPDPKAGEPSGGDPAPPATPDPKAGEPTDPPPAGEDWAALRTRIAKGDEKLEKRLARYSSVESMAEALIAAQNKIAEGVKRTPLPKDATPEQKAAWRAENGIPESIDAYKITPPEGVIIGAEDQPIIDEFINVAHEANMSPEQVNEAVGWYLNMREQEVEALAQYDQQKREETETQIRELWGAETQLNKNLIVNFVKSAPEGIGDQLLAGRLADGTPIFSSTPVLRWMADLARTVNPIATIVPGSGQNASQAMEDEIAILEKMMGDNSSDYWKGPKAERMQERYRQLVDVRERTKRV